MPQIHSLARRTDSHGLAVEEDGSRGRRFDAEKGKPDIGATRPDKARESEHLAPVEIEGDAFEHALATEIGHCENEVLSGAACPRLCQIDLAADHVGDGALWRRFIARARRYQASVAKDRDLVGDLEHLLHAMADEEDGDALPFQVADKLEQLLNLVRGERRRRLVHDQDADVERNGLGDFDRLLGGQCQSSRRIPDVQRDAEFGQDPFGVLEHLPPVDHRSAILVTDENVLGDVEIGKQQRLLIDGGDA